MNSNTDSTGPPIGQQDDDDLCALEADASRLAARNLDRLPEAVRVERVLRLRRVLDGLEGQWLKEVAGVDARGAAGAEENQEIGSTAAWLRRRLRLAAHDASAVVRTARALFRGPLQATGQALTDGAVSPAHARVLATGTKELPDHRTRAAEPILLEAARQLDPTRLRRVVGHLVEVADPEGADERRERRHARRGLWLAPTFAGMVAVDGLLEPEAGQTVLAALEPLARPAEGGDLRSGPQRTADALTELARRQLEGGRLPKSGGVRPQLSVVVDLNSLLGHPGAVGGDAGWAGPLDPEACRRLGCDGAVTRVVVSREPSDRDPDHQPHPDHNRDPGHQDHPDHRARATAPSSARDLDGDQSCGQDLGVEARLRAAMACLPPILGGARSQPLDVGRTTRVVQPAQRAALAVRDGGCVFSDCSRPLAWCEAHHLVHWLDGGPTDLNNLALLCRAHHRAVHEGGWRLVRDPDGRLTSVPPHRRPRTAA